MKSTPNLRWLLAVLCAQACLGCQPGKEPVAGPLAMCQGAFPEQIETAGFRLEYCQAAEDSWRRVVDLRNGTQLDFPEPPQRVVSQSLGTDEVVLELLPPDSGRLVAVSAIARSPRHTVAARLAERIEETVTDKTEQILALQPDLVLAASYSTPETLHQLANASVPTLVMHRFGGIDDAMGTIRVLTFALLAE